jgi:hypothetical protein
MFGDAPPPSARSRRPVPPDIERVTMGMLRRDREVRHDAAAALAAVTACAAYPRSGREVLAALLPERIPERAPRRGSPRPPRPQPPAEPPAPRHAAEAAPPVTALAVPRGRHRPGLMRAHGSMVERARRHPVRTALLGAVAIGALVGAMLHVTIGGNSSAAPSAPSAPVPAAPSQPDTIERARPAEVPRAEEPGRAPGSGAARRDDANPMVRRTRVSAPVRPPASGGMRIIDLRPEAPEPGPTGRARGGSREIDLGPASD